MEFKKYQHIEKLGSSETDGILKGTVHLSFKIDGTNGCIYLRDGELTSVFLRNYLIKK